MSGKPKKAHPLFLAVIIGVPLLGVVGVGYAKFGGPEPEKPKQEIIREGSAVDWEKALKKGMELEEKYQPAIRKISAAQDDAEMNQKTFDPSPHIKELEGIKSIAKECVSACTKMLASYKTEQKAKYPNLSDAEIETKLGKTDYGKKKTDWERLMGDVDDWLRKLNKAKAGDTGGSTGESK